MEEGEFCYNLNFNQIKGFPISHKRCKQKMQIIFRWSIKLVSVVGGWLLVGISEFVEYLLSVVGGVLVERRKLELVSVNGGSDSNRTRHSISLSQNYEARY